MPFEAKYNQKVKGVDDTSWPPDISELGDAETLTKGNAAGTQIDPGPVFNREDIKNA